MIKNFNEFVNENFEILNSHKNEAIEFIRNLMKKYVQKELDEKVSKNRMSKEEYKSFKDFFIETLNFDSNECMAVLDHRLYRNKNIYTIEEIKKIVKILNLKDPSHIASYLKVLLSDDIDNKQDFLKDIKNKSIVIGIDGKVLSGEVYYNKFFDMYTESEEQMIETIETITSSNLYKTIKNLLQEVEGEDDSNDNNLFKNDTKYYKVLLK